VNVPETLLRIGAALQFTILIASAMTPKVLNWKGELAGLHPFLRRLFWVYGVFIVMTFLGFATISVLCVEELAAGSLLARSFCGFTAAFWFARLLVQFFVFDAKPFLTNWFYTAGYHGLTVLFIALTGIYGWLCFRP
jgi:hypothetical protein